MKTNKNFSNRLLGFVTSYLEMDILCVLQCNNHTNNRYLPTERCIEYIIKNVLKRFYMYLCMKYNCWAAEKMLLQV